MIHLNNKISSLSLSVLALFGHGITSYANTNSEKPNLLIIMTDEHSIRTLGCYRNLIDKSQAYLWGKNNNVKTPNLDRLASEGAMCLNFYSSSPVSTPARASFQTGYYPATAGAPINGMAMDANKKTFAHILKDEGYQTTYVGKWHLAGTPNLGKKIYFEPGYAFGWDNRCYMFETKHQKWYQVVEEPNHIYVSNKTPKNPDVNMYSTDFLTNRAIDELKTMGNKPFCLMLSIPDPHSPDLCREPYTSEYGVLDVEKPSTATDEMLAKRPLWGVGGKAQADSFNPISLKNYFAMVKCVDDNVGKILDYLDHNNLTDNTIVVFTSDHGDMLYNHMRIDKGCPYDDAVRVPFIIRYPKKIKAGKIIETPYSTVDFVPTILSIMNAKQIEGIHGKDESNILLDERKRVTDSRTVYITDSPFTEWTAATDGRYKLVLSCRDTPWLFDIKKDPMEIKNFYNDPAYKEIAKRLQNELVKQMKDYDEPALKLKRPFLYSSSDKVIYVSPYKGLNRKQIGKIETETLNKMIFEMHDHYYRNY